MTTGEDEAEALVRNSAVELIVKHVVGIGGTGSLCGLGVDLLVSRPAGALPQAVDGLAPGGLEEPTGGLIRDA